MQSLSRNEARHLALASQGIDQGLNTITDVLENLNLFQVDSVNVFARAHLMPAFTRIGAYDLKEFETLAFGDGELPQYREYWAHCAALIQEADWPLFEFRRNTYLQKQSVRDVLSKTNKTASWVLQELKTNGPMTIGEFEHDLNKRGGSWWGWSEVKQILERLLFAGVVVSAGRIGFQRRYALAEDLPAVAAADLTPDQQKQALLLKAARSLGAATESDLADYFRFYPTEARRQLEELLVSGDLEHVSVEGWEKPGFVIPGHLEQAQFKIDSSRQLKLLSPFDPIIWNRNRAKRLFDFDYLIEIYVPEAKRTYGYYTLPILYKDRLIGRVDLKHERKQKQLIVKSLWHENLSKKELLEIHPHLEQELQLAKNWIGAETLIPPSKGNWAF